MLLKELQSKDVVNVVDGNKLGTSFLVDDIKLEEIPDENSRYKYPYLSDVSVIGTFVNGAEIRISAAKATSLNVSATSLTTSGLIA